jgi:hypothetical protein
MKYKIRTIVVIAGILLIGMAVWVGALFRPEGSAACARQCSEQDRSFRYTPPVVGYRNHQVVAEKCECY